MIVRDDITAETYCPLPFSTADLRGLENAIEDRVGKLLTLDLGNTETGEPFISVMAPGITWEAVATIIRSEHGWQMHRGGDGPLYEFASEREVAEFFWSGGLEKLSL
jgi:hypothetical protein